MAFWNSVKNFFIGNTTTIIIFFCVLILAPILIKFLLVGLRKMFKRTKLEPTVAGFLVVFIKFVLILVYVLTLFSLLKIPITSIVALITALSLAVGLAIQNSVSNIANGLVLLSTKPYKVGDYVDIGSASGTVVSVKMIHTVLLTPTGEQLTLPHNTSANAIIKNYSMEEFRRVDIKVSVEYTSNIEQVKDVLTALIKSHSNVVQDKDNYVRLLACSSSSMDFILRAWVKTPVYWDTYFDLQEQIVEVLRSNNIAIPYNTMDVNLISKS